MDLFLVCFLPLPARSADAQSKRTSWHTPAESGRLFSQRQGSGLGKFEVGRIGSDQLKAELAL